MKRIFLISFALLILVFFNPESVQAQLQKVELSDGIYVNRSLEGLRDLDYHSWQVVVYKDINQQDKYIIRIVGFPGTVRLDHTYSLHVVAGRQEWDLSDITLFNPKLANDPRQAAAEFDLTPLLDEIKNIRPLRIYLNGVFEELPVPPYLVAEWRSLMDDLED